MRTPPVARARLVFLISGSGSTLQNFIDRIAAGDLAAEVVGVISSKADVAGLERARQAGIPAITVARGDFDGVAAFNDALHEALERFDFDLILFGGFLSPFQLRGRFENRVMNVHPSLIPAFSGKGFYGERVHRAVLDAGVKLSGCTVHFANDEYDRGPIILQSAVPVLDDDTPQTLAARVQAEEKRIYPEAVRLWVAGQLVVEDGRVRTTSA